MSQHYSDPERESDPHALPDLEIFYRTETAIANDARLNGKLDANNPWCDGDGEPLGAGWFFWYCFPGRLPDSDPIGPFGSEAEALADAQAD
jgi:hypothetical protein